MLYFFLTNQKTKPPTDRTIKTITIGTTTEVLEGEESLSPLLELPSLAVLLVLEVVDPLFPLTFEEVEEVPVTELVAAAKAEERDAVEEAAWSFDPEEEEEPKGCC